MKEKKQKKPLAAARQRLSTKRDIRHPGKATPKKRKRAPGPDWRKIREEARKKKHLAEMVTLVLYGKHRVNGVQYGPGKVTIPRALAQIFIAQEQRILQSERELQQSQAYMIQAGAGGPRKREVPTARIDAYLGLDVFAAPM